MTTPSAFRLGVRDARRNMEPVHQKHIPNANDAAAYARGYRAYDPATVAKLRCYFYPNPRCGRCCECREDGIS